MAEPETPKATVPAPTVPGGRWKTWALVLSLGVNLFVAAAVLGAGLRHHREVRDVGFGPFTNALTREDRMALRDAFMAAAPDVGMRRRTAAEDAAQLAAALRADPWDAAAVEALPLRQGARAEERFALGRRLFLERLGQMTPEARGALADRIERMLDRGRKGE